MSQDLPPLGESGSGVSHFIPEPRNFSEVTKFSDEIKKSWVKATLRVIRKIIHNQNFIVEDPEKDKPVTSCMDFLKAKIKYDGILHKLKPIIVVRGYL